MASNIYRTHDKHIYLQENRYEQTKEAFKLLVNLAKESGVLKGRATVSDFGCAAGEFLYHLHHEVPNADCYGYDLLPELLDKAKAGVPGVTFLAGSVLDSNLLSPNSTDLAFMFGVHSIFEEFEPCISNLIKWTRPGGRVYILGLFNKFPVDVWVKYRMVDDPDHDHREPGWNIFSKTSVSKFLDDSVGSGNYTFTPFEMPFDLEPNPADPVRTWTFSDADGRRLFTNGLSLICNLEILEIRP